MNSIKDNIAVAELRNLIKSAILKLDLHGAQGVGILGSLVRGDFTDKSDIDIFVVVENKQEETDSFWKRKIREGLKSFGRDTTVLVYTLKGLKEINNWYVLRLASEGILIYDKANVQELFKKIIKAAKDAGLKEIKRGDSRVWSINRWLKKGETFEVRVW